MTPPSNDLRTKYRPRTLDEVVGQDAAVSAVREQLKTGRSRAFLLSGPPGTGKTTLGRIIAGGGSTDNLDVTELDAASNNGVEDIRELVKRVRHAGVARGRTRAVIVDEIHALSARAWDPLLKPIEEPPAGLTWVFCTTEPERVPPAIKTRCCAVTLRPVDPATITDLLKRVAKAEGIAVAPEVGRAIVKAADGSPRLALSLLATAGHAKTYDEAKPLLAGVAVEEGDAVPALAKAILNGAAWPAYVEAMKLAADADPESVRVGVCAYLSAVAKRQTQPGKLAHVLGALEAWGSPLAPTQKPYGLVMLSGRTCLGATPA